MSKTRKIFGIIIAITLVLNVTAIAAFAADDSSKTNEWTLVSDAFTTEPTVGNTFTVDLKLLANYNLGPVQFALEYDSASFGIAASGAINISGYPYEANVNYNYDTTNKILKVVIVPDTAGLSELPAVKLSTSTTIATITFTYLKGGTIEVADDYKTDANISGSLCAFRSTKDNLLDCTASDLLYGQTPTITEGDHEVGTSYTAPTFQKKSTAAASIQITSKTVNGACTGVVYGFPQAATSTFANQTYLTNAFEVINGTMEISKLTGFLAAGRGTGTLITVKDTLGVVKATYIVVIFGDLDGNGLVNTSDLAVIIAGSKASATYFGTDTYGRLRRMAANMAIATNAAFNNTVNTLDIAAYVNGTASGAFVNQGAIAANHTAYPYAAYA